MKLRILSLDTASPQLRLSYGPEDGGAWAVFEEDVRSHGPGLLARIDSLLGGAGPEAVDVLACCRGPGSFTGIRIGLSFAKTMAAIRKIPLYLLDSFDLHLLLQKQEERPVWVLLDARRDELYVLARGETASGAGTPRVASLREILETASPNARFLGSGAILHRRALEERFERGCVSDVQPDARTLHEAARNCLKAASPVDPVRAEPLYLRASDAELNLAAGRIRSAWSRVFSPSQEEP